MIMESQGQNLREGTFDSNTTRDIVSWKHLYIELSFCIFGNCKEQMNR